MIYIFNHLFVYNTLLKKASENWFTWLTSHMAFSVWVRENWHDCHRCYACLHHRF